MATETVYKIGVNIPGEFAQRMMDEVTASVEPLYPKYSRTFYSYPVRGTWIPLPGSDPYDGEINKIQEADELRVEFAVSEKYLRPALEAVRRVHPYEEPAIDVIPMLGWKSVIASD